MVCLEKKGLKSDRRDQKSAFAYQNAELDSLIGKAYSKGLAAHGDLGLTLEAFAAHLKPILAQRLGAEPDEGTIRKIDASLHTEDLYLAAACAHKSDAAWNRFAALYEKHIDNVSHSFCSTHQDARELATSLLAHLLFSDHKGQSRIASYEGRSSLAAWLATIIKHQEMNRRQLKSNEALPLDSARLTPSTTAQSDLDAALLNGKYRDAIADSLAAAVASLSEREKLVLVLHLEAELTAAEIARRFGVHRAQVTRTIHGAQEKLRMALFAHLSSHHGLAAAGIEECVTHILQSPETSLGVFLREAA